jgi:hypothetical protein
MMTRKLSKHIEDELFDKEKRDIPTVFPEQRVKLQENVEPKPVKKKKPYYRKKYNKPKTIEIIPEPTKNYGFFVGVLVGFLSGLLVSLIFTILT